LADAAPQLSVAVNRNEAQFLSGRLNYCSEFGVAILILPVHFVSTTNSTELQRYKNMVGIQPDAGFLPANMAPSIGVYVQSDLCNQREAPPASCDSLLGYAYKRSSFFGTVGFRQAELKHLRPLLCRITSTILPSISGDRWAHLRTGPHITNLKDLLVQSPPGVEESSRLFAPDGRIRATGLCSRHVLMYAQLCSLDQRAEGRSVLDHHHGSFLFAYYPPGRFFDPLVIV